MNNPLDIVSIRPARAHGWLRRPECDTRTTDAWEKPDGSMIAMQKGHAPMVATMPSLPAFRHLFGSHGQ